MGEDAREQAGGGTGRAQRRLWKPVLLRTASERRAAKLLLVAALAVAGALAVQSARSLYLRHGGPGTWDAERLDATGATGYSGAR